MAQRRLHKTHQWLIAIVAVCVFCGALIGYFAYTMLPRNWSSENKRLSEAEGDRIIADLHEYRRVHGMYPRELAAVGTYPRPPLGMRGWLYTTDSKSFKLSIRGSVNGYPFLYYESQIGSWAVDE